MQSRNLDRSKHRLDRVNGLHINRRGPHRFNLPLVPTAEKRNRRSIGDSPKFAGHETKLSVGKEVSHGCRSPEFMPHRSGRRPKSRSLPDARPLLFACAGSISLMTRTVDDIVVLLHGSPPAGIRSTDARGHWRLGERFSHVQARWFGDRLGATSFGGLMDWFGSLVVVCLQWIKTQKETGSYHGAEIKQSTCPTSETVSQEGLP
jgi:hypothetical protein